MKNSNADRQVNTAEPVRNKNNPLKDFRETCIVEADRFGCVHEAHHTCFVSLVYLFDNAFAEQFLLNLTIPLYRQFRRLSIPVIKIARMKKPLLDNRQGLCL